MRRLASRTLVGAAVWACLCAGVSFAQVSKLDARLRARRPAAGAGALGRAASGGGERHRVMLRLTPGASAAGLSAAYPGVVIGASAGGMATAWVPESQLDALAADPRIALIGAARLYKPTLEVARSSIVVSGKYAGTLRNGLADVASLSGSGVVVGIVDSGIDWRHKDFSNDGSPDTTRILSIWDQTISSHTGGLFPSGYSYGAEYTKASIDAKLAGGANIINTKDLDGHGTHVASIAAGDGSATNGVIAAGTFKGFAPAADIIMVKTTFADADIVDGMAYIAAKAAAAGKRAVINLSLGGQGGPHDGTSAFETGISAIAASTPVFIAMGNDHADAPHAKTTFVGGGTSNFSANVYSQTSTSVADLEFWHPAGDAYTVTVTLLGLGSTTGVASGGTLSTSIGGHTVQVWNATNAGHPAGDKEIFVRVSRSPYVTATQITAALTRTSSGGSGRVDGFVDPAFQSVSWGSFVDNTLTMCVPATALHAFPVGSYASKATWNAFDGLTYSFNTQSPLGEVSHFSGWGPTRDGRQAPELVAPGDVMAAAMSADADPGSQLKLTDARHRILRGTSMAAPAAAGIAATRLQAQPGLTVPELRAVLRALARTDAATGSVPNNGYGYGKVTASPQPVSPPAGFSANALGTSSIAWSWGAVTGASDYRLSYATNTGVLLATVASPFFSQTGLSANTTYGLFIRGMAGGVEGPGTSISTSTYATAVAPGAATAHVSSVTLAFTPCPASPSSSSCSGYALSASTAADFTGAVLSSATSNRALSALSIPGLSALTTYYLRLATLNSYGGGVPVSAGSAMTLTDLVAPSSPSTSEISSTSLRFHWTVGANPPGLTYTAQASSMPGFTGTLVTSTTRNTSALLTGLSVNTSYYLRVQAVGGPYLTHGPVPTKAVPATAPAAPFSGVSSGSIVASWTPGLDPPGTLYEAQLALDEAFSSGVLSSATRNASAGFRGLTPNTVYYARVNAVSHGGISAGAVALGSTATFAQPVSTLPLPFSGVGVSAAVFSFGAGSNPAGTRYNVRLSTDPAFSVIAAASSTLNTSATFTGLLSNQLYWAQAAAINLNGAVAPFSTPQSTATRVGAVSSAGVPVSSRTASSLTAAWSGGSGFGAGTQYLAEADDDPAFGSVNASSTTRNAFATLPGLAANTVYHVRVRALSQNAPTPDGPAVLVAASQATLANLPVVPAPAFSRVGASSFTVSWLPPLAGTYAGFRVEASASPDYASPVSSEVAAGARSASLSGLSFATTYYARVAALNSAGAPSAYAYAGSTFTARPLLSSGTATGGGIALSLPAAFPEFPEAALSAEPGTFPSGTVVRVVAGTSLDLAAARGALPMTMLGAGIGYQIDAAGYQPAKPVRLMLSYDAARIPPGQDARRLRLARYDEPSGLWQLVPSAVDAKERTLTASLDHFSNFAPFFTSAGAEPDQVLIFPNPWEMGGASPYTAPVMTFGNLPDGASVKLLTMAGELVWEADAGPSGVLTWDGNNRFGHKAGSATYFVVIRSGGKAITKRAVLIR